MILIDFSSIIHRKIHTAISQSNPKTVDGKHVTKDFIGLAKYYILQELFDVKQEHESKFGEMVICLDKSVGGYWRKDVYPGYKSNRKSDRDKSLVDFKEVFKEIDELIEQMELNLPWKVISLPRVEADDIILVLAREYNKYENVLIYSPDKDMIQAQRDNDTVFQYSSLTKKWLVPEGKHDHMDHWIQEHVCLGDVSDSVPKVVDHTEFSENFINYLKENNIDEEFHQPYVFRNGFVDADDDTKRYLIDDKVKKELISNFKIQKQNRKGENIGILDIYKDMRFGSSTLVKALTKFGSLDKWLDSHPLYRQHYDRNFTLVMEEGIPTNIWNECVLQFKEAVKEYKNREFEEYLKKNSLNSILMSLPNIFKLNRELTAEDFNW